jgi:hypothetical protein
MVDNLKTYRLSPNMAHMDNPCWQASLIKETCWTLASSEGAARHQVARGTIIAVERRAGQEATYSPWLDAKLVDCGIDEIELDLPQRTIVTASGVFLS